MLRLDYNVIDTPPPSPPAGERPPCALLQADELSQTASAAKADTAESLTPNALSHRESGDDYALIVAQLDERWRVIECACGIQWILQYRRGSKANRWQGKSFCQTKSGLELGLKMKNCLNATAKRMLDKLPTGFQDALRKPALVDIRSDMQPLYS